MKPWGLFVDKVVCWLSLFKLWEVEAFYSQCLENKNPFV